MTLASLDANATTKTRKHENQFFFVTRGQEDNQFFVVLSCFRGCVYVWSEARE